MFVLCCWNSLPEIWHCVLCHWKTIFPKRHRGFIAVEGSGSLSLRWQICWQCWPRIRRSADQEAVSENQARLSNRSRREVQYQRQWRKSWTGSVSAVNRTCCVWNDGKVRQYYYYDLLCSFLPSSSLQIGFGIQNLNHIAPSGCRIASSQQEDQISGWKRLTPQRLGLSGLHPCQSQNKKPGRQSFWALHAGWRKHSMIAPGLIAADVSPRFVQVA